MTPATTLASCHRCAGCFVQAWHAATAWRLYWPQLAEHVARMGWSRITPGALS